MMASTNSVSINTASELTSACTIEQEHVHKVYDETAHHFRNAPLHSWPRVTQFLADLPAGSLVADVGCGQGKYLNMNPATFKLGCDYSSKLVAMARSRGHEVMTCDALRLPYRDGCFDAVISIAVIHHLTTSKRRAAAIRELSRVLRPGGKVMIYVWAMEQKHRKFKAQDVLVPWRLRQKSETRACTGKHGVDGFNGNIQSDKACVKDKLKPKWSAVLSKRLRLTTRSMSAIQCETESSHIHRARKHEVRQTQRLTEKEDEEDQPDLSDVSKISQSDPHLWNVRPLYKDKAPPLLSLVSAAPLDSPCYTPFDESAPSSLSNSSPFSVADVLINKLHKIFGSKSPEIETDQADQDYPAQNATYEDMLKYILKEEEDFLKVKHSFVQGSSAPGNKKAFAVRQFPYSSQAEGLLGHSSKEEFLLKNSKMSGVPNGLPHSNPSQQADLSEIHFPSNRSSKQYQDSTYASVAADGVAMENGCRYSSHISSSQTMPSNDLMNRDNNCYNSVACQNLRLTSDLLSEGQRQDDIESPQPSPVTFSLGSSSSHSPLDVATNSRMFEYPSSDPMSHSLMSDTGEWDKTTAKVIANMQSNLCLQGDDNANTPVADEGHLFTPRESREAGSLGIRGVLSSPFSYSSSFSSFSSDTTSDMSDLDESGADIRATSKRMSHVYPVNLVKNAQHICSENHKYRSATDDDNGGPHGVNNLLETGRHKRYYHVFKQGELVKLVKTQVPDLSIMDAYYDHANWCVVAEKGSKSSCKIVKV